MQRKTILARFAFPRAQLRVLLAMTAIFAVSYVAAFWLRFEGDLDATVWALIASTIAWVACTKLAIFCWFDIHRGWGRHITFHGLIQLCKATTVGLLVLVLVKFLCLPQLPIPRSVLILDWILTVACLGGIRSITRFMAERDPLPFLENGRTPVLIIGTNTSAEALLRTIRRGQGLAYRVVGFITQDHQDVGSLIDAVPVLGTLEQTCELAEKLSVRQILITAGDLPGKQVRQLMEEGQERNLEFRVLANFENVIKGDVNLQPRDVSIEDLLRRNPVQLHTQQLTHWLDGQTVLVTGSAGSIGSELCRQILKFRPRKLVLVDRSENGQFFLERELRAIAGDCELQVCLGDTTDQARMNVLFDQHRPEIVFHASAYKHVPLVEDNVGEAIKNVPLATQALADLAHRYDAQSFVMISTDKAVNPTSVMGTCKRVAELYVQALAEHSRCRFVTVRFGNVLGSAGSVVPIFREQIARGGPVTITHPEMNRFFMTIPEASQLVMQAGAMGNGGEVFVLDMGEPVKIVDLAEDMIRLSGYSVGDDIAIEYVGLRPGEKMYEELYTSQEEQTATPHPKITVAASYRVELNQVRNSLNELAINCDGNRSQLIALLKKIVPEFSQESPADTIQRELRRAA